jgi:hypothetical protein
VLQSRASATLKLPSSQAETVSDDYMRCVTCMVHELT